MGVEGKAASFWLCLVRVRRTAQERGALLAFLFV